MSRLTYKDTKVSGGYNAVDTDEYACVVKLGKLEDLEEQIGCPLEVIFEATKYGFWYKVKYLNRYIHLVPDETHTIVYSWNDGYPILQYMEVTNDICFTLQCVYDVFITDYKKTWWLKEDKSE